MADVAIMGLFRPAVLRAQREWRHPPQWSHDPLRRLSRLRAGATWDGPLPRPAPVASRYGADEIRDLAAEVDERHEHVRVEDQKENPQSDTSSTTTRLPQRIARICTTSERPQPRWPPQGQERAVQRFRRVERRSSFRVHGDIRFQGGRPSFSRSSTSPQVVIPVPKSITSGSGSHGKANAMGLVPKMRSIPPDGATRAMVFAQ